MIQINKRSIGACIILSLITFGIYSMYWEYLLVKNTRSIKKDDSSCVGEMLCLIFVPFYSLYWWFTRGKSVRDEFSKHGYSASSNETAFLVLALFGLGIVAMAIMQNDFNSLPSESTQSNQRSTKKILKNQAAQSILCSFACIFIGLLIGFIVLLCIDPKNAGEAMITMLKNFWKYTKTSLQIKYLGNTLVKTAPLLLCSISILFSYKLGLFNIGAAGQYVVGACASLYAALAWNWNWVLCILFAMVCGAVWGSIVGLLKSYCNVNEVISGIMLNWIALYAANMILSTVKEEASPYTFHLADKNPSAILPNLGLDKLFNDNKKVTIAIPTAIICAIAVYVILEKTKFGFELKATGYNKNAAKYCGMAEKRNIIISLAISGSLAALGACLLFLTDFEQWECTQSSVPSMGFNGISACFLGGINPLGTIISSFFIQHINDGGAHIASLYCSQISDLITSIIIYLCGFVFFLKYAINKYLASKPNDTVLKADAKEGGTK